MKLVLTMFIQNKVIYKQLLRHSEQKIKQLIKRILPYVNIYWVDISHSLRPSDAKICVSNSVQIMAYRLVGAKLLLDSREQTSVEF